MRRVKIEFSMLPLCIMDTNLILFIWKKSQRRRQSQNEITQSVSEIEVFDGVWHVSKVVLVVTSCFFPFKPDMLKLDEDMWAALPFSGESTPWYTAPLQATLWCHSGWVSSTPCSVHYTSRCSSQAVPLHPWQETEKHGEGSLMLKSVDENIDILLLWRHSWSLNAQIRGLNRCFLYQPLFLSVLFHFPESRTFSVFIFLSEYSRRMYIQRNLNCSYNLTDQRFFFIYQIFCPEYIISFCWALASPAHNIASVPITMPWHCNNYKAHGNFWCTVGIHKVLLVVCFKIKNKISTYIYLSIHTYIYSQIELLNKQGLGRNSSKLVDRKTGWCSFNSRKTAMMEGRKSCH